VSDDLAADSKMARGRLRTCCPIFCISSNSGEIAANAAVYAFSWPEVIGTIDRGGRMGSGTWPLRLSMAYQPLFVSLANSLSGTVTSPEGERVGFTLPRWTKLSMVNKSTPIASAASLTVNWRDADVVMSPAVG